MGDQLKKIAEERDAGAFRSMFLTFWPKVQLITAMQGRLGLELAREHHPDLVLLDLHLPDVKGDEILRRIKADEQLKDTPVVILSADVTPRQTERLLEAGAYEYLPKPVNVKLFRKVLEDVAAGRARGSG